MSGPQDGPPPPVWPGPTRTVAAEHPVTDQLLGQLTIETGATGVVLGRDSIGRPVLQRIFRPEPLTVVFIGRWWAAEILVLRCLAHGASVAVEAIDTPHPGRAGVAVNLARWLELDRAAGGTGDRVWRQAGDLAGWPASEARPLLRLRDTGPAPAIGHPALPPWQTQLTVLTRPTTASMPLLAGAGIVIAQRLDPPDADLVGHALALRPDVVSRFPAMEDEMIAVFHWGLARYAWLMPTSLERLTLGGHPATAGQLPAPTAPAGQLPTATAPTGPQAVSRGPSGSRSTGRTPTRPAGSA